MNRFRDAQAKRLSALTKYARSCKRKLNTKMSLAERILKLGELARKLETENEKVLPFYESSGRRPGEDGGAPAGVEAKAMDEGADGADASKLFGQESGSSSLTGKARAIGDDGKPVKEWNYLDRFYRRYNKVLLDKLAIAKEKERLERENHDLQAILKQYLDGISVNEDVMRGPNPLLVVNGRVNLNAPPVRRTGRVPVVEGNHMLSTHRVATS